MGKQIIYGQATNFDGAPWWILSIKSLFSRAPLQCQVPSKVSPIHSLQGWLKRKALGSVIPRPGFLWRRGELMQPRDHLFGHPCRWLFKTTSLLLDVLSPILVKLCSRVVYMFAEFLLQRRRHAPSPARALWRRRQRRSTLEQGRPDGRTDDSESMELRNFFRLSKNGRTK